MKKVFLIFAIISFFSYTACKNKEKKEIGTSNEETEISIEEINTTTEKTAPTVNKTIDSAKKMEASIKNMEASLEKVEVKINDEVISTKLPSIDTSIDAHVNGIKVGDTFITHSDKFKRASEKDSEGPFKGYRIMNTNADVIGFAFPNTSDASIIGMIEITSNKHKTTEGIAIGSTFEQVKKAYPNSITYGNKIESSTSVKAGNYFFILNTAPSKTDKVDESKIKPLTKVKKIIIK